MPRPRLLRWARAAIPFGVTVALLVWLATRVDRALLFRTFRESDPEWLALALVVSAFTNVPLYVAKWRAILVRMGHAIPFRHAFVAYLGCFPIRFLTPLKVGEVLKAVYLNRRLGLRMEVALASVAFDKATNVAVVSAFAIAGTIGLDLGIHRGVALAILVPLFLVTSMSRVQRVVLSVLRWIPGRASEFAERLLDAFHGIPPLGRIPIWGLTIVIVLLEALVYDLCAKTMGVAVPYGFVLFVMPLIILFANIPITASGVGIREAAIVYLCAPFGPPERLLAWGICVSIIDHILVVVLGLPFVRSFVRGTLDPAASPAKGDGA